MNENISVRALEPDDWQIFRAIRLKALREHPDVYLSSFAEEEALPENWWQETLNGKGKQVFGLFDGDKIVGHAAVFTWRGDSSGHTGVMAMDYVDAAYRGRHLSRLLYQARLDWAEAQMNFKKLIISHRDGNEASRRANQAFGFAYTGREIIDWPDGTKALELNYELDLEALRKNR